MTTKLLILALLGVLVVTTPAFTQVLLDPSVDPLAQGYQTVGTAPYQPSTFLNIDDALDGRSPDVLQDHPPRSRHRRSPSRPTS